MQNAITTLRIQNFKSIKDVTMQPRRVNIIIGEPNVGKSNILEALSLLGGMVYDKGKSFMDGQIRYERAKNLFFDNLLSNTIRVESNKFTCFVSAEIEGANSFFEGLFMPNHAIEEALAAIETVDFARELNNPYYLRLFLTSFHKAWRENLKNDFAERIDSIPAVRVMFDKKGKRIAGFARDISERSLPINTRFYSFDKNVVHGRDYGSRFLEPPKGDNIKNIIQAYPLLRKEVAQLFAPYGLRMLLNMDSERIEIIKDIDGVVYSNPYSSTADTFQRLIFYLAAIESNDDAVLLFEEPEAHSFPSYIMHLAQSIVESRNNQFFVVTHNPYLLTEVLEEMMTDDELKLELAIFAAYYEDYQTKIYQLTDEDMVRARADGLDFFLNLRRFVPEAE